jgi:tetratricopeptide (TPR) repeat protein
MGTIYSLYLDQYDEALQLYNILIRNYPGSSFAQDALFNTGMVLYEKGAFAQAHKSFKGYIAQYPDGKHRQSAEVWAESARAEIGAEKAREPEPLPALAVDDTTIRVLIRDRVTSVALNSRGLITLSDPFSGSTVYKSPGPLTLTAEASRLLINGRDSKISGCVVAAKEGILALDGTRYRGTFRV